MSLHDGIVLPDQLAVCIDCGEISGRLLPERFPHICQTCLFPPAKQSEDPTADLPPAIAGDLAVPLVQRIQYLTPNMAWTVGESGREKPFGHRDPHQSTRRRVR